MPLVRFHFCAWVCRANAPGAYTVGPVWDRPLRRRETVFVIRRRGGSQTRPLKPSPFQGEGGWPLGQTDEGDFLARGPVWDRPLRKTKSVPAVHPSRTWAPPRTKARFQPGGETPKGCRKLSGSGHRTETSQLSHPRLCVDQPRRPNWRPRKMGVQGGASISDGAKPHSICGSPLAVLWLLSARADCQVKCNGL